MDPFLPVPSNVASKLSFRHPSSCHWAGRTKVDTLEGSSVTTPASYSLSEMSSCLLTDLVPFSRRDLCVYGTYSMTPGGLGSQEGMVPREQIM